MRDRPAERIEPGAVLQVVGQFAKTRQPRAVLEQALFAALRLRDKSFRFERRLG